MRLKDLKLMMGGVTVRHGWGSGVAWGVVLIGDAQRNRHSSEKFQILSELVCHILRCYRTINRARKLFNTVEHYYLYMAISNSSSGGSVGSSMGSPKDRFVEFFFEEFRCYTNVMRSDADEPTLDRATTALLSICPDPVKRRELYRAYTKEKMGVDGKVAASSELAGNFMSHMSEMLEFTEKSYASVF